MKIIIIIIIITITITIIIITIIIIIIITIIIIIIIIKGVPNPGCLFIGHGAKTLPVTWLTGNQIVNFAHKKNQPVRSSISLFDIS
jgi:hypothetical protein